MHLFLDKGEDEFHHHFVSNYFAAVLISFVLTHNCYYPSFTDVSPVFYH